MAPLRRSLRRPKGIGGVLVRQLTTEALDRRVPLRLRVLRGNSALHFYERLGFLITEQTPERTYMKYRTHPPLILPRLSDSVVTASGAKETFVRFFATAVLLFCCVTGVLAAPPLSNRKLQELKDANQSDREKTHGNIDWVAVSKRDIDRQALVLDIVRSGELRTDTDFFITRPSSFSTGAHRRQLDWLMRLQPSPIK